MKTKLQSFVIVLTLLAGVHTVAAQGTDFTYQGRLNNAGGPANGIYDITYKLWNASSGGAQVGSTFTATGTPVTNGLFTATIGFGNVFNGSSYWLELAVRTNGIGSYQTLTPRQELTPTPYAITAENVDGAIPASQLTGTIPSINLSGANGSGLVGLNASQLTTGIVPDAVLPPDVAYTDVSQTFTVDNSFTGNILMLNPLSTIVFPATAGANAPMMEMFSSGTGNADRMVIAHSSAYPTWGLQYQDSSDKFNFLSSGTPVLTINLGAQSIYTIGNVGIGTTSAAQQFLSVDGGLNVDQIDLNAGFINNGNNNGYGITFGSASGEGIASQRTAGVDLYSLEFYTAFANRMIIMNNGFVGIGTTNPAVQLDVRGDVKMGTTGQYFATGGTENLRIVRGIVRPEGTIYNGTDFTVTHVSTGTYSITFNPAFADAPSLTITSYTSSGPVTADCTGGTASGFSTITTWVNGVKTDNWWNFSAIGGR